MFSPILDAFVMFSSPNRRRKRVVQEEEENFRNQQKTKTREKSPPTVGAHPSVKATSETLTVIFASSFISEYKAAPETHCIKAINAKKAVNNFVAVNCMLFNVIIRAF